MYIFTQTFNTQVHQRITVTNIFPLYPDKPVLSYLLSLFWHLRFWQIQIFRVRRHAWSYSGAVKDKQLLRWNETSLLPQGSHGAPMVHRQLSSFRQTVLRDARQQQVFDLVNLSCLKTALNEGFPTLSCGIWYHLAFYIFFYNITGVS